MIKFAIVIVIVIVIVIAISIVIVIAIALHGQLFTPKNLPQCLDSGGSEIISAVQWPMSSEYNALIAMTIATLADTCGSMLRGNIAKEIDLFGENDILIPVLPSLNGGVYHMCTYQKYFPNETQF